MTVEAIKAEIAALSGEDRRSLVNWLNELDYDAWDRQMVRDFSPGGRGMALAERVRREMADGQGQLLDEGLARSKRRSEPSAK